MKINMRKIVTPHLKPCILVTTDESSRDYDNSGELVKPEATSSKINVVVLPISSKLVYELGGRYTTSDIRLISLDPITLKSKVIDKGKRYSVEEEVDYTDFSDFHVYLCRTVGKRD